MSWHADGRGDGEGGGVKVIFLIAGLGIGGMWGWIAAHHTVAAECERLGGFFVGQKVYKCHLVESREDGQ